MAIVPLTIPIIKICRLESGLGAVVPMSPGCEIIIVVVVSPDMMGEVEKL